MRLLRLVPLLLAVCAAPARAQAPADAAPADAALHPDSLLLGAFRAVLEGPAFTYRVDLTVHEPDTTVRWGGTALTHARPPEGIPLFRLDYDEGGETAAFDGAAFQLRLPRTQRVYVDSTVDEGMATGVLPLVALHPTFGLSLARMHAASAEAAYAGPDAVDGRPCQRVDYAVPRAGAALHVRVCYDDATRLPSRITMADEGVAVEDGGVDLRVTDVAVVPVPPDSAFTLALPEGYRTAPFSGGDRPALAVGEPAPPFTLATADGAPVALADYAGRTVLLDFWGTWCPPCAAAIPRLQALAEAHPDLVVLGLASYEDPDADPTAFARARGGTYPILLADEAVLEAYRIWAFPTYVVVGPDGAVAFHAIYDQNPAAEAALAAFLEAQAAAAPGTE